MPKAEYVYLRVVKGGFVPATAHDSTILRERGYKAGDVLRADIRKERNPAFNALVHAIGRLCTENIDEYRGMDAHAAIKRLQVLTGVECDEQLMSIPGVGEVIVKMPRSVSFASMGQERFKALALSLCRYIAEKHYPGMTAEQVQELAEAMIEE